MPQWLEVLPPEVAKVEGNDYGRFTVDRGRQYMTIFFIVGHPANQRLVTADPRLPEMGTQIRFEIRRQRTRPPKLQFQGAGGLTNDLLRHLGF